MSDDGAAQDELGANGSTGNGIAALREEYIFGDEDNEDPAESPDDGRQEREEATQLNEYPIEVDYYATLGLPKDPPPSDDEIRSAFRLLSPSLHPDKHPGSEQKARDIFQRLETAYDVLIDPQKRVVYDMLGPEGVTREWDDNRGEGLCLNHTTMVGVRAMDSQEFKELFLSKMRQRERRVLESMVGNRVGPAPLCRVRLGTNMFVFNTRLILMLPVKDPNCSWLKRYHGAPTKRRFTRVHAQVATSGVFQLQCSINFQTPSPSTHKCNLPNQCWARWFIKANSGRDQVRVGNR